MRLQTMRSWSLRIVATIVLSTSAFYPAAAFELFGFKFFEKAPDPEDLPVGDPQPYEVTFTVNAGEDDDDVEDKLKGASNLWGDREEPASGASGLLAKARGDYRRLLGTMYAQGRYGPTISIRIDGREAADLAPDAQVADPANVVVTVDPGPVFAFGVAEVVNQAPAATNRYDRVDLPSDNGFMPGEPARSGVILQAENLSKEAWRQQGYAKAAVAERRVEALHDTNMLDATLVMEPGRRAVYGATAVQGTARMDPDFVAYMTDLPRGEEFDPDDVKRANDRLGRLEVFRSQRIEEGDTIAENGELPMTVIVQERPLRRFGVGASYSTLDGAGVEGYWLHRNLFGKAERLRFDAKVAGIGAESVDRRRDEPSRSRFDPAAFTYRVGVTYTKPGVFTPDTNFVTSLFGDREVLDRYTRTAVTAQVGFTHIFSEELSGSLFLSGGPSRFEDDLGERDFLTVGLPGTLTYDTRGNKVDATTGFFVEAMVEPFFEFEFGNPVLRGTLEGRTYYGFGEDNRVVAAGRLKIGSIAGADIAETPPDRLFFAGGGGSVRGYEYRGIGVEREDGIITGGRSLIEGSAELRAKVTDSIGLVGFVDAGYVGAESFPDFAEELKIGAGVGLRYLTGLGPIRGDVAIPLNRGRDDPSFAFYIGIGQAF
jgi:translocation and assembly module TamA